MEIKKLKLALKSQTVLLSANALVFGALAFIAGTSRLFFWILIYLADAAYIRLKFSKNEESNPNLLFASFLFLVVSLVWFSQGVDVAVLVSIISAILMFTFLGSQIFYFSKSKIAFNVFYQAIIFGIAVYFASVSPFDVWWGAIPLIFYAIYGSTRDYLRIETGGFDRRKKTYSLIFSLLAIECIWLASLLPFGFLNSGAIVLIFSVMTNDVFLRHLSGKIKKEDIIKNSVIMAALTILIFVVSSI